MTPVSISSEVNTPDVVVNEYLSYSGRSTYKICPYKYKLKYIDRVPIKRDPRSAMPGWVLGKVFQWFYDRQLWMHSDAVQACLSCVPEAVDASFIHEKLDVTKEFDFRQRMIQEVRALVPGGVEIIRQNGFLTNYSLTEVDLSVGCERDGYDFMLRMGGRCDFIHSHDRLNVTIVDGKATRWREKYVDPEQLLWYGVQHTIKYHVCPKRLGFIFWAFPHDPLMWIDFDTAAMVKLVGEIFETMKSIRAKSFGATPSNDCKLCEYRSMCEVGTNYMDLRAIEARGRITDSIFLLEEINGGEHD
jgi:hypothetical protein